MTATLIRIFLRLVSLTMECSSFMTGLTAATEIRADRPLQVGDPLFRLGQGPIISELKISDCPLGIKQSQKLGLACLVTDPSGLQRLLRLAQHGGLVERDHLLRR